MEKNKIKLYAYGGTCIKTIGKISLNCGIKIKNYSIIKMKTFVLIKE